MSSQLLINEPPLQVLPTLAQKIGLNEAIVLQQVHYWLNPRFNENQFEGCYWVRNTYEQWKNQFPFWCAKTIRRVIVNLEEVGLLKSFVTRDFKKTKYYTLNYGELKKFVDKDESIYQQTEQNKVFQPSGQIVQVESPKWVDRRGQIDQADLDKLSSSIYMDSENTYSENTLPPPLTPPSHQIPLSKLNFKKEEEENKIYHRMMETWNKSVQAKFYSGKEVHLTDRRLALLRQLYETVFNGNEDSWGDYCTLISQSRYLSGHNPNGFKATLDWALVPDNAYKVLEGAIYDKPEPIKPQTSVLKTSVLTWEEFSESLARTLPSSKYLLPWLKISINLAKQIGQVRYKNWFSKVFLTELSETKVVLSAEGEFTKNYIRAHFQSEIRCAIQSLYPKVTHIDFQTLPLAERA